jgi:hypothetical protein
MCVSRANRDPIPGQKRKDGFQIHGDGLGEGRRNSDAVEAEQDRR